MPGEPPHAAELERFLAERDERLLRTAILLAGGQEEGKDLLFEESAPSTRLTQFAT